MASLGDMVLEIKKEIVEMRNDLKIQTANIEDMKRMIQHLIDLIEPAFPQARPSSSEPMNESPAPPQIQ